MVFDLCSVFRQIIFNVKHGLIHTYSLYETDKALYFNSIRLNLASL